MRAIKILKTDNGFGQFQVSNIESVTEIPPDETVNGRNFTYRQGDELNRTITPAGASLWPVAAGYGVVLHDDPALCQYFDAVGNPVDMIFIEDPKPVIIP